MVAVPVLVLAAEVCTAPAAAIFEGSVSTTLSDAGRRGGGLDQKLIARRGRSRQDDRNARRRSADCAAVPAPVERHIRCRRWYRSANRRPPLYDST